MAQSALELKTIHLRKLATPNSKYYGDNEEVYVGNSNGSLRLLNKAQLTTFKSTTEIQKVDVQEATNYLRNREIEVDFGTTSYQTYKVFNIIDSDVIESSKIIVCKSLKSPSDGRSSDEVFAETLELSAKAYNNNFDLYVKSLNGSVRGKFIINYKL